MVEYSKELMSERLKLLMKQKHLSAKLLSSMSGVSYNAINQMKYGYRFPNTVTLMKLSKYFNVSVDYLLGRKDIKYI